MDPTTVGILAPDLIVYFLIVTGVITALFALWPVRKTIVLANKSQSFQAVIPPYGGIMIGVLMHKSFLVFIFFVFFSLSFITNSFAYRSYCVDAMGWNGTTEGIYAVLTDLVTSSSGSTTSTDNGYRVSSSLIFYVAGTSYRILDKDGSTWGGTIGCAELYPAITYASTYPYAPPEPSHCSDYVKTDGTNEVGIDCGGDCSAVCVTYCPPSWILYSGTCYSPEYPMINGLCPEGTVAMNLTDGTCLSSQPPLIASSTYDVPVTNDYGWVFNDENSPWVSDTSVSVVDNGDGTSTEIISEQSTINNPDGSTSTSTSTTTNVVDNSDGSLISSTSTGSDTQQTIGNYGSPDIGSYDGVLVEGVDYPVTSVFADMLDSFDGIGDVGTALGDTEMIISNPVCKLTANVWNSSAIDIFNVCDEPYTSWFDTFRLLILSFAYLSAIYIVFRR